MVGAILGLVSSIVSGALSSMGHEQTQDALAKQAASVKVPESVRRAEAILREQSNVGLPGYRDQLAEIDASIPATLNQAKDYVSSGGLIEALGKIYSESNKAKRQLGWENDKALIEGKNRLAEYIGGTEARFESAADIERRHIEQLGMLEGKAKTADWINSLKGGTNSIIGGLGNEGGWIESLLGRQTPATPLVSGPQTPTVATFNDQPTMSSYDQLLYDIRKKYGIK